MESSDNHPSLEQQSCKVLRGISFYLCDHRNKYRTTFHKLGFLAADLDPDVTGNSIPFAHDIMGIFPRYMNVRYVPRLPLDAMSAK